MTTATAVTAMELRSRNDLAALDNDWSALCDRARASIFQRPEWLLPYAESFPGELAGIALFIGRSPVALLLLVEDDAATASLLGTGLSDHLDAIVDDGFADAVCRPIEEWIARASGHWRRIDFQQLPAGSVLLRIAAPDGFTSRCAPHEPCPVVPLGDGSAAIPSRMARKVEYYTRRAASLGEVSFDTATPRTCDALLDDVVRLHGCRWANNGGVFADPRVVRFHRALIGPMAEGHRLALHVLRVNGTAIAASYGFVDGRRASYYIGGFDPAFADISPGTLTLARAIEDARRRGAREFDLLRGRERYKYFWGAADEPTFRRLMERRC